MEPACSLPSSQQPDILNYMNPFLSFPSYSFMLRFNTLHRLLVLAVGLFLATPFMCLCSTCVQVAPDCCNLFRTVVYPKNYWVRIPIRPPLSVRNGKTFLFIISHAESAGTHLCSGLRTLLEEGTSGVLAFHLFFPQSELQH
jgi:hypothetical protein